METVYNKRLLELAIHLDAIEIKQEYNILEVWIEWPENHVNSWIAVKYNSSFFINMPSWFEEWEFSEHFQEPELREIKDLGFAGSCMNFFSLSAKEFSHLFDTEGYQNTKMFGGECLSKCSSAKDVALNIIDFVKRRN